MARFDELDSRFDPYASILNQVRSEQLLATKGAVFEPTEQRPEGLSVVILNLNRPDLLESLWLGMVRVQEYAANRGLKVEFLVGDTGSTDWRAIELLAKPPTGTRVIRDLRYHFSSCNNKLFALTQYQTILFLNNDVLIADNPVSVLLCYEAFQESDAGVLGTVMKLADGTVQHVGVDFFQQGALFGFCYHPLAHEIWHHNVGAVWKIGAATGAFLMIDATDFVRVGGFDESYEAECQDVDLCLKMHRVGKSTVIIDSGPLVHLENATRPTGEENWKDRAKFMRRWNTYVEMM